MNFSDSIPQSNGLVAYGSSGDLVAVTRGFEVKIYETGTLRPIQAFTFADLVSEVEWSPDNRLILVGVNKRNLAFVRSIEDPNWHSKID
jgi:hypothetical protein